MIQKDIEGEREREREIERDIATHHANKDCEPPDQLQLSGRSGPKCPEECFGPIPGTS